MTSDYVFNAKEQFSDLNYELHIKRKGWSSDKKVKTWEVTGRLQLLSFFDIISSTTFLAGTNKQFIYTKGDYTKKIDCYTNELGQLPKEFPIIWRKKQLGFPTSCENRLQPVRTGWCRTWRPMADHAFRLWLNPRHLERCQTFVQTTWNDGILSVS